MRITRMLTATVALVALTSAPAMADDAQGPADGPAAQRSELQGGIAPTAAGPDACERFQFCIYKNDNYTGIVARLESCVFHDVRGKNLASYVNRQTAGTRARFYSSELILLSHSKPAPDRGTIAFGVSLNTAYVRPC